MENPMTIKTTLSHHVASVEIDRPQKKNAITGEMYLALAQAVRDANANPAVRCVLITGQPGVFTAGNDLEDFMHNTEGEGAELPSVAFMRALVACEKPVIAAVTGLAVGIGTTMLLHCDLVYVSQDARLSMPFVGLGLVPEFASSLMLPALVGHAKAAEMLMLGEPFGAEQAVAIGIANAALPAGDVIDHARRVAERFNGLAPSAVRETKKLLKQPRTDAVLRAIAAEVAVFTDRLGSPEVKEALSAFFQKRKPDFSRFS
jgi:enoyl-CoA hydratase/carnithine racemase